MLTHSFIDFMLKYNLKEKNSENKTDQLLGYSYMYKICNEKILLLADI